MSEQNDEIYRQKVDFLVDHHKQFLTGEVNTQRLAIASIVIIVGIFSGLQFLQYSSLNESLSSAEARLSDFISGAEERIDEMVGGSTPTASTVAGIDPTRTSIIFANLTISRFGSEEENWKYRLSIEFPFQIGLVSNSPPGEVIGYSIRFSENLANFLATTLDGEFRRHDANYFKRGASNYFEPALINNMAPIRGSYSYSFNSTECARTEEGMEALITYENEEATITPLFKNIEQTTPETLRTLFVDKSLEDCSDFASGE